MEDWQKEAIEQLLSSDLKIDGKAEYVRDGRLYLDSNYRGTDVYHMVSYTSVKDLIIDQIDSNEKYQQRVYIEEREVKPFLRALLLWHLADIQKDREWKQGQSEDGNALGDLDDHPF